MYPDRITLDSTFEQLANSLGPGYFYVDTLYFTSNDTFSKATYPWLRAVIVKVQGGGGAGGGAAETAAGEASHGGGGAGGGYAEKRILADTLGASESITIGAAGAVSAGGVGGAGGSTSFGTHASGAGGSGGPIRAATSSNQYPSSSVATGGDGVATGGLVIPGQPGSPSLNVGTISSTVLGGNGGGSRLGSGGRGRVIESSSAAMVGRGYGAGGGGNGNSASNPARNGGAGTAGIVIVELYA